MQSPLQPMKHAATVAPEMLRPPVGNTKRRNSGGFNVKGHGNPSMIQKYFVKFAPAMLIGLLAILAMPGFSRAQDTGYISGTVTDKSGAAVANAEVVIVSAGKT